MFFLFFSFFFLSVNAFFFLGPGCHKTYSSSVNGQFFESYRGAVVKVVCNPGYTLIGSPSVYCNGIAWNETFPRCKGVYSSFECCCHPFDIKVEFVIYFFPFPAVESNPVKFCQFETEDLCGWSQDPIHDVDWKRQNRSSTSGTVSYFLGRKHKHRMKIHFRSRKHSSKFD